MPSRLTADQQGSYQDHGYLIFDQPVFSQEIFDALKAHVESQIVAWTEVLKKPPELIDRSHFIDPKLNDWLLADEVIDLVEPIIGPDVALFASSFINKGPSLGTKSVAWHDDASYWRDLAEDVDAVTVWLAIDRSTPDNGCMRVIPGTHHDSERTHVQVTTGSDEKLFNKEIEPGLTDESEAVDCILDANHCSLHDAYLIHGSYPGGSTRRVGFQMRYMPTTVRATDYLGHEVYLARGKDRAGNDYGDPTKVNEHWLRNHPGQRILVEATQ